MSLDWSLIARHAPALLQGLGVTLLIALVGLSIATVGGALVCAARRARSAALSRFARGFIAFFRITPEVVLIFWAYFCIPLLTGQRVSGFWAGSVTLGLIGAAYLAEIFRGGIETVPRGQTEAAQALGLKRYPLWRCVVLPQALRFSVPPLVNYFTEFLKNTTLLAAIGVPDLALQAYLLGGQTFRYLDFLTAIALIYFALIFPFSLLSRRLELRHAG
jgi:His/Glu/Gln/Arg/opine family amino acid ABC transporter permease subunit